MSIRDWDDDIKLIAIYFVLGFACGALLVALI